MEEQIQEQNATATEADVEELFKYMQSTGSAPVPEEKYNLHVFLHRVATEKDTKKLGFLKNEEIGSAEYPIRSYGGFAIIAEDIIGNNFFKQHFEKESENITASSLSRDGFLIKQATTQVKKVGDITRITDKKKGLSGLFKKKEDPEDKPLETS